MELLAQFSDELQKKDLRSKVIALIPAFHTLRDLGCSLVPVGDEDGGRDRILVYLKQYPTLPIDGEELMVVSGESLWPRRVRELRQKFGWPICGGETFVDLAEIARALGDQDELNKLRAAGIRPGQYVLMTAEEDRDAPYRWNVLREVRSRSKGRPLKEAMLAYFRRNLGYPITAEELKALGNGSKRWVGAILSLMSEEESLFIKRGGNGDKGVWIMERNSRAEEHDSRMLGGSMAVLEGNAICAHGAFGAARRRRGRRRRST